MDISISMNLNIGSKQLWRVLHDVETSKGTWRAGLPEVFPLNGNSWKFDNSWQMLAYAMNPGMAGNKFRSLYRYDKAFTNGTGFDNPNDPRADYVNKVDLYSPLPRFDKARVCGGATITGVVDGDDLIVDTLDGNGNPPELEQLMKNRTLFFHAVNSTLKGITRFPQNNGNFVLVPLVSNGEARISLSLVEKVPDIADPYYIGYRKYPY